MPIAPIEDLRAAECETMEEFYLFILDNYGDETEQAKKYRMGVFHPEYKKDPKAFRDMLKKEVGSKIFGGRLVPYN